MFLPHSYCRACGYAKPTGPGGIKAAPSADRLIPVFSLGAQPLANDFKNGADVHNGLAPLEVLFCPKCTLAQLSVVVDPVLLYQNYAYITSGSQMMQQHFDRLWHTLCVDAGAEMKTVVEIGSNDGKLLKFLGDRGVKAVGIDPAQNLAKIANDAGLPTVAGFLSDDTVAEAVKLAGGLPDCILARHVFCHIDDWKQTIALIESMCGPKTLVAIEVPNIEDLLNAGQFDTIYHEHLSFMSVPAMEWLLTGTDLFLEKVHHFTLHGGSIAMVLRRGNSRLKGLEDYDRPKITLADWQRFGEKARRSIAQMQETVKVFRSLGKRVAGFGASAKSTVWMNACHFTRNEIEFIADNTPFKQLKFSPGTDIPIADEGRLIRDVPDYAILHAWNYRTEVLETQKDYVKAGGHFIVPIPRIEIVP